jgi:hypothetical protein
VKVKDATRGKQVWRAKQLAGLGDFEVRKYMGLIRHWLCSRIVMYFLAARIRRLRGEKSADHVRAGDGCLPAAAGEDHQLPAKNVAPTPAPEGLLPVAKCPVLRIPHPNAQGRRRLNVAMSC